MVSTCTRRTQNCGRWSTAERRQQRQAGSSIRILSPTNPSFPANANALILFVPFCLSASHVGFGSIRMEPVFMVLGQSSALAAILAIEDRVAVQDVDYEKLRKRLTAEGLVLSWTAGKR